MRDLQESLREAYRSWSKGSGELVERARKSFPGGDTRMSAHYAPHPLAIESGQGCRIRDVDGHELIDFMNNFTSLLLGHCPPGVVQAIAEQAARGTAFAAPTRAQVELAEQICDRVDSVEQLRFCSSGSEATLMAIRCARAATGRQKVMKMEGGYHGSYELAEVSLVPYPHLCGLLETPQPVPVDPSFPATVLADTVVAPFNRPEAAARLIAEHAGELAAVIVEPVQGSMGMIPASAEFLRALRDATAKHGVVLIFDEVITLRLSTGGMQKIHGIVPDMTAMGKVIGGGLPIGAVGGSYELMQRFNPDKPDPVFHASTFSANPMSMAAGLALMREYTPALCDRINALGDRLRAGFDRAFAEAGVRGQALGFGSLANLHLSDRRIESARDTVAAIIESGPIGGLLHLGMLRRGIFAAGRLMFSVSAPMTEREIDAATAALAETLEELRPLLVERWPELLC